MKNLARMAWFCVLVVSGCSTSLGGSAPGSDAGSDAGSNRDSTIPSGDGSVPDVDATIPPPPPPACDAPGTFEYPFGSGTCIDDPCAPDACAGVGSCSNITGVAVCTPCTYFVDPTSGDDAHAGTSAATAWRTLSHATTSLAAGDNVCLQRGGIYRGSVVLSDSGTTAQPLRIASYGDGAAPVLTAMNEVSDWTAGATGVWSAPCPGCGDSVSVVAMDGLRQQMGRYPNLDAPNGGYLTYESVIGPSFAAPTTGYYTESYSGPTAIIDNELPASPDWTGAEIVVRKIHYVIERHRVTSQVGTTLNYPNPMNGGNYTGVAGWGYFFQDSPLTLDQLGEWYYNPSSHTLSVYFGAAGPAGHTIEAAVSDQLLSITNQHDIVVDGLTLRGANNNVVQLDTATAVTIQSCNISIAGMNNIQITGGANNTVVRSVVLDAGNGGIVMRNSPGASVLNNLVTNSGVVPGQGAAFVPAGNSTGVYVGSQAGNVLNSVIEANRIENSGYNGVHFNASGVTIRNNFIRNFTLIKTDGGGLYTWRDGPDVYTARTVVGNIVLDGHGAPAGNPSHNAELSGCVYLDNATPNVELRDNTFARCGNAGIQLNYAHDCQINNNTFFDSPDESILFNSPASSPITGLSVSNNLYFARNGSQLVYEVSTATDLTAFGTFTNNALVRPTQDDLLIHMYGATAPSRFFSLSAWQALYGREAGSTTTPLVLLPYQVTSDLGPNLVTNGEFETDIAGVTSWPTDAAYYSATRDSGSRLNGVGSLSVNFLTSRNQYQLNYARVGAVSSAKDYLMRVSTVCTTEQGRLRASLRTSADSLTPVQDRSFGTERVNHEFLFHAPTSADPASFQVALHDGSGTVFLDGIELHEVTSTALDPDASIRFEYNDHSVPVSIALDGTYVDGRNVTYTGSVTLQPYTSAVLMKQPTP